MKNYDIKINVNTLLHYSELRKSNISNQTLLTLIESFASYIKKKYMTMLYDAIYSSRYRGKWEPIEDPEYSEYLGTVPSRPIIELMYEALEIRRINQNIIVRFNPKYMYPESKLTLLSVINAIDSGTSKFNAHPIMMRVIRRLSSSIPKLWRKFLKQKEVI